MQVVSNNIGTLKGVDTQSAIKPLYTEKISRDEVEGIRKQLKENSNAIAYNSTFVQSNILDIENIFEKEYESFQNFLKEIGYEGKPIAKLSQEEATEIVSENGFFGVFQTSERIANFVVAGASGDEEMLRAGREGVIQGYKEAENLWGGELPDISQKTIQRAIELIDKNIYELGFSIIDKEV